MLCVGPKRFCICHYFDFSLFSYCAEQLCFVLIQRIQSSPFLIDQDYLRHVCKISSSSTFARKKGKAALQKVKRKREKGNRKKKHTSIFSRMSNKDRCCVPLVCVTHSVLYTRSTASCWQRFLFPRHESGSVECARGISCSRSFPSNV